MTIVIGVDPGVKKCAVAEWDGKHLTTSEYTNLPTIIGNWKADTVIIEKPVAQGPRSARNSTFDLVRVADRISQAAQRAGLTVYEVPVQVIREQAGIARNRAGQDFLVMFALRTRLILKYDDFLIFKRGGILSNADKRDAAMCALWNYKAAENQQYKVTQ